eukprot:TCONS_00038582-protein
MKTATDVIHRILWDDALPTQDFIVGYLDRFVGIIEKPFTAFSWEDIASVDMNVLAVPKHRIQYFKYLDVVVWDKNKRMDKVFGSTGNSETILDIIDSQWREQSSQKQESKAKDEKKKQQRRTQDRVHDEKNRPNYFLCVPITDPEIRKNVKEAQDHITTSDNRLTEISHDADRLHVTLCMFRLNTEEDKSKAKQVLQSVTPLLPCLVPLNSYKFDVKYTDHFNRRVVYAGVYPSPELLKLQDIIVTKLKNAGIHLCGNHDEFTPHLTMLKITRPFMKDNDINEINPFVFNKIKQKTFGKQQVSALRICETGPERGADNFYVTLTRIENSLLSISDSLPQLVANNLTNQMSQGIIDEGLGDSLLCGIISAERDSFEKETSIMERCLIESSWESTKKMIILRGLPGSGKSEIAKKLMQGHQSCKTFSADGYFTEQAVALNTDYKFVGKEIDAAHKYCRDRVIEAIQNGTEVVIIDNTHSQRWEYRIYERLAILCGFKSHVVEIECSNDSTRQDFQKRCIHHVTDHVHKEMYTRWEHDPQAIMTSQRDQERLSLDWITDHRDRPILYSALFLDQKSKDLLKMTRPPTMSRIHSDHMTLMYDPTMEHLEKLPVGTPFRIELSGYAGNNKAQAMSVIEIEDQKLCMSNHPHVTIATNKGFRPGDVEKMLDSYTCQKVECDVILTGVVGVRVAINERESVTCIDEHYFKKLLAKQAVTKVYSGDTHLQSEAGSHESEAINLYNGPLDVIKCINVFDFDSTLFFTPDPVEGRQDYQKATGTPWPYKGWLSYLGSLSNPLLVYPGPSLKDYKQVVDRANSYTVLCTGRLELMRFAVEGVLALHGLGFDEIILKPNDRERYSRSNVKNYKKHTMTGLMKKFPRVTEINFWDDRIDNIESIQSMEKFHSKVKFNLYHVQDECPKSFWHFKTSEIFGQLGLVQDEKYKMAVEEVISLLSKAWLDVIQLQTDPVNLIHYFGSNLLGRRSDVDLCLLAPSSRSPDECISKMADKLREYGFEFVHAATGIRCPRLKLKAMFCNYASISFDMVVACVLPEAETEIDFEDAYRTTQDKKSKIALDGVLFHQKLIIPILDRISESDIGMLVDAVILLLRRRNLKGNAFHCIRTFHIVKLLADFIHTTSDALPTEDLDNLKDFEKVLKSALRYFAELPYDSYVKLFKSFVPYQFIEPIIECFADAAKSTIMEILYSVPRVETYQDRKMTLKLEASNAVEKWKAATLFEARFGTLARQLIDRGFTLVPGHVEDGLITFYLGRQIEEVDTILRDFIKEFEHEMNGVMNIKILYSFKNGRYDACPF